MHPWIMQQLAETRADEMRASAAARRAVGGRTSPSDPLEQPTNGPFPRRSGFVRVTGELLIRVGLRLARPETLPSRA